MFKDINDLLEKIPVWKELMALPKKVQELEERIKILEAELNDKKLKCPYCKSHSIKAQKQQNSLLNSFVENKTFICTNCESEFKID